jgi:hypothetical protein
MSVRTLCGAILGVLLTTAVWAQVENDLKIVVIEGEDGVNIIDQKTAVKPVVEVRDRNNLPIVGVVVTFVIIEVATHQSAVFANNLKQVTVVTDSTGRAAVSELQPVGDGPLRMEVRATYQGRTVTTEINQTNFQTAADAVRAGKDPNNSQSQSQQSNDSQQSSSQPTSQPTQIQSVPSNGSNAGSGSGSAAGAGSGGSGATGATGAAGSAAAGGGSHIGLIAGVAAAGAAAGTAYQQYEKHKCDSEEAAVEAGVDRAMSYLRGTYYSCVTNARTDAQFNACVNNWLTEYQRDALDPLSSYCSCVGPQKVDPELKSLMQDSISSLRSMGLRPGNIPSCFQ